MSFYKTKLKTAFIVLFFYSSFYGQGKIDGIVAIVGKQTILHSDILQQAQMLAINKNIDPSKNPYLFESVYQEVLAGVVNQYVILDAAEKDTNIVVSGEDVDRALEQKIDEFIKQAGSRELFEKMMGMPLRKIKSIYWNEIKNMMYIEQYRGIKIQPISISRQEVLDFYKQYKDSIPPSPETYTYSIIEEPVVPGDEANMETITFLDSLKLLIINNVFTFDSLAKQYSEDPGSATMGGFLGYTARGSLVQPYEEAAYSLDVGNISSPIKTSFGYHLIKLIDKKGEKVSTQHILRTIFIKDEDYLKSVKKIDSIYNKTKNDPFMFDSIAVIYKNNYKNNSGVFTNIMTNNIDSKIIKELKKLDINSMSKAINIESGVVLVYLYKHQEKYYPTPTNSWNIIYEYALRNKQNYIFNKNIEKEKEKTYIKLYYN